MGWNVEIWPVLYLLLRMFICRIAKEVWHSGIPVSLWDNTNEEEEKLIFYGANASRIGRIFFVRF